MKKYIYLIILSMIFFSCKKNYDAQPTYAGTPIAGTWALQQPFYQIKGERYDDVSASWKKFSAFTFTSDAEPDKVGFANPYVAGKGTNALDFNRLYTSQNLTSDSGYYNVTIPKCFQFIPKSKDSLTSGTVDVLTQSVRVYRKDKTFFDIIISPSDAPGNYNTITKYFEIEIRFDETSIGGPGDVKRKYRFNQ